MDFVQEQRRSQRHITASILLPLVILAGYVNPYLLIIGTIAFFLITSFKMLKAMIIWMILLGGLMMIFPFIAPVVIIFVIIVFILRIGFILSNVRPFISGVLLYGAMVFLMFRTFGIAYHYITPIFYFDVKEKFPMLSDSLLFLLGEGVIVALLFIVLLQVLTTWSYKAGHTSYVAYGVMGSAPLLLIALLLPFLKMGADFVFESAPEAVTNAEPPMTEVKGQVRATPDSVLPNNASASSNIANPSPIESYVEPKVATTTSDIEEAEFEDDQVIEEGTSEIIKIETRNSALEGLPHPETGVEFHKQQVLIEEGKILEGVFPDFDEVFEAQLTESQYHDSDAKHFKEVNSQLKYQIENDPELRKEFTKDQIEEIEAGDTPEGYVWHHSEHPGQLELVDSEIHAKTGHTGGRSIWGGGSIQR